MEKGSFEAGGQILRGDINFRVNRRKRAYGLPLHYMLPSNSSYLFFFFYLFIFFFKSLVDRPEPYRGGSVVSPGRSFVSMFVPRTRCRLTSRVIRSAWPFYSLDAHESRQFIFHLWSRRIIIGAALCVTVTE